ncbi:serine/threonine-protein kinase pim-1-like [Polypterus senegalus]|uniref:serine/threonine-protein kinase pim-1-like n=1 Tax=Polypterus senegalus TaxID=55291 RepID=UPI0019641610|nr:serine/threonine-protein kinase pim-1-like [Polypterus senegalus]
MHIFSEQSSTTTPADEESAPKHEQRSEEVKAGSSSCEEGTSQSSKTDKEEEEEDKVDNNLLVPSASSDQGFVYVDEKYQIGEQLANGGLGTIFEGIRKSDKQRVALKVVEKNGETMILPDEPDPIPLEVGLMKLVSRNPACPHVIQLLDWCETDTHVVLVLERPELCQNLHTFIKQRGRIGEPLARHFCYQLVKALQHCESREVFHRDVKPSNILVLLTTNDIKLIDFGCGDLHEETAYEEFCGTKAYAPPECLKNHGYYSTPTTVWTLGLTLAFIVSGHLPFEPGKNECIFIPSHVSQELQDLLCWCLCYEPEDRPGLEEILLHPWMNEK